MSSILRINNFAKAADQAYISSTPKYLKTDHETTEVTQLDLPSSFSAGGRECNKRTREVFRKALLDTIGQKKFDWICYRYRKRMNFTRDTALGNPLLPEHVELFSIGASQLVTRDIKEHFLGKKIREYSRDELTQKMKEVQPFPLICGYQDPVTVWGSPSSLVAYFFHDVVLMDKEKQILFSNMDRLDFPIWSERFTKTVINRELLEGRIIPALGNDGRTDYYKVYRKITTGDGLVAYALRPATNDSTLQHLIAFRPSQWPPSNEDALPTYRNDMEPNIGETGWKAAESLFDQLMNDPHFKRPDQKVRVAGYSLGGAHAQYFVAQFFKHVNYAIFYNAPSIDRNTVELFAQQMNSTFLSEPFIVQIFRMEGDPCDCIGGKHLFWGVTNPNVHTNLSKAVHEDELLGGFWRHSHRIYDNVHFQYNQRLISDPAQLLNELDNSARGIHIVWYEKTRRMWGAILYHIISALEKAINLLSGVLGVKILRSSVTRKV